MKVRYGHGVTKYGPGVRIELNGDELETAVVEYLERRDVKINGPRTVFANRMLCEIAEVYVDPSGSVTTPEKTFSGRGE